MENMVYRTSRFKRMTTMLLALTMIALPVSWVLAENTDPIHQESDEEGTLASESMAKVTIVEKTLETVTTNIGDRYVLSDETIITTPNGKQVSVRKMLVPCEAEISYEIIKGKRTAQRIKVVRIENGASWQWTSKWPD